MINPALAASFATKMEIVLFAVMKFQTASCVAGQLKKAQFVSCVVTTIAWKTTPASMLAAIIESDICATCGLRCPIMPGNVNNVKK